MNKSCIEDGKNVGSPSLPPKILGGVTALKVQQRWLYGIDIVFGHSFIWFSAESIKLYESVQVFLISLAL